MFNLFSLFRQSRIWDFAGGIHPPEMKLQSSTIPLRQASLPGKFIIPLKQHLGPEGELCVTENMQVLRGQPLTEGRGRTLPVHAPTSGRISAIIPHTTAHPSGLTELSVILLPDGEDRWLRQDPMEDFRACQPADLLERIHQSGIAGLGGAGFPTAAKMHAGLRGVKTLIINAAECEPYITADDRLMQENADEIVHGMDILSHMLSPESVLIGIEDNKPEAITALQSALRARSNYHLRVIPTKYPSGGAKQLTRILTGQEVPYGLHSGAIGVLMFNIGTVFAIKRAVIDGEALTERVVTLTGNALAKPGNVWARLGTPVSHLLQSAGFTPGDEQAVIMGGPLMGFTLPTLDVPIVKISNCIMAPSAEELSPAEPEQACIRCSRCADACPAGLLPQQLYWFSQGQEHDKARQHHLFDCIECGACAYVCPSNIPLVKYYRQQKAEIRSLDRETERAAMAKTRYEAKMARREREKLAREARHLQAAVKLNPSASSSPDDLSSAAPKAAVADAIARIKAKKAAEALQCAQGETEAAAVTLSTVAYISDGVTETAPPPAAVSASRHDSPAKAATQDNGHKAAIAKPATASQTAVSAPAEEIDPRQAAVAAAIARVKARKMAAETHSEPPKTTSAATADSVSAMDPRKAAVAAALARVKARKAAEASTLSQEE